LPTSKNHPHRTVYPFVEVESPPRDQRMVHKKFI
jgi:hypothetical protein